MINNQFFKYVQLLNDKFTRKPEYNLFRVLRSESDEVRLHSRFLGDLLNPKGSHHHKSSFLKLFLQQFSEALSLDLKQNVLVDLEFHNIDILIRAGKTAIILENKIYAGDQEKQLSKYYRKMSELGFEQIKLVYLTLTGYEPSDDSTNELPIAVKKNDLVLASYEKDIYEWVSRCIETAARDAPLREACIQYLNIISKITNKIENHEHMEELKSLLLENNNLSLFPDLACAYKEVLVDIQLDIWEKIAERLTSEFGKLTGESITLQDSPKSLIRNYVENRRNSKYLHLSIKLDNYEDTYVLVEQDHHIYFGIYCENEDKSPEYNDIAEKTKSFEGFYQWDSMPIGQYAEPSINFKSLTAENLAYLSSEANRKIYADYIVHTLKDIVSSL